MLKKLFYYNFFVVLSILSLIGLPSVNAMDAAQDFEKTAIILSESDNVSPDFLEKFSRLESLKAPCNQHITNEHISRLTNLTELDVRRVKLVTGKGVANLVKLESLNMGGWNQTLNDSTFSKLTNLTDLDIYGCQTVTAEAFKYNTKLKLLNLWGCMIENDKNFLPLAPRNHATPLTIIISNDGIEERRCYWNYKNYGKASPMGITAYGNCVPSCTESPDEGKDRVSVLFPEKGKVARMIYRGSRKYMFNISYCHMGRACREGDCVPGQIFRGTSEAKVPLNTTEDGQYVKQNVYIGKDNWIALESNSPIFGDDYTDYSNLSEIIISCWSSEKDIEGKVLSISYATTT